MTGMERAATYGALLLALGAVTACEVRVREAQKAECPANATSADEFKRSVVDAIRREDFRCAESQLVSAKSREPAPSVFDTLQQELAAQRAIPDSTRAYILGYLLFAGDASAPRLVDENVIALRKAARSGNDEQRTTAISVLSTRRSDQDLDVFVDAIASGEEMLLAYSAFALADNCSLQAKQKLSEALKSPPMIQYLRKYADRESISGVIRRTCPELAGMAQDGRRP